MQQQAINEVKLVLEHRKRLTMSAVEAVDGFSEQCLKLTVAGCKVLITGENIKITAYNKGNGNLSAEGEFSCIKYGNKKAPVLKKLFK